MVEFVLAATPAAATIFHAVVIAVVKVAAEMSSLVSLRDRRLRTTRGSWSPEPSHTAPVGAKKMIATKAKERMEAREKVGRVLKTLTIP